jgi:GDP-4-dehydro-6-deoxy-D-mannose reductase
MDLLNPGGLTGILVKEKPDYLVHLAGVNKSEHFRDFYEGNVFTTIHILEDLVAAGMFDTKILLISSSAVYGRSKVKKVDEQAEVKPVNYYGSSKLAMEEAVVQFIENHNLKISIARPFNLIGPGQSTEFALPSFIRQLCGVKYLDQPPLIRTGNLDGKRDFLDVTDAVSAYWKILNLGKTGEIYNIGSGLAVSINDVLDRLIRAMNLRVKHEIDKTRIQHNQIEELASDNGKLEALGWKPEKSLDESLKAMIVYYEQFYQNR